jgi:hypothetical protein
MKKENPQAARTGGQTNDVVHEVQNPRTEDAAGKSDEELRHFAVARLAEFLDMGSGLVERCEHLAAVPKGDRLAPIYAAARLMHANANVARSFAYVAQVERRQRTIIEHIQPTVLKMADSNSTLENRLEDDLRLTMLRYLKLLADETLVPSLNEAAAEAEDKARQDDAPQDDALK